MNIEIEKMEIGGKLCYFIDKHDKDQLGNNSIKNLDVCYSQLEINKWFEKNGRK